MKTHWKKLDNPNYLGAYSLMDGEKKEVTVEITKVITEEVTTKDGKDVCKVAYLEGLKPMILNTTNCNIIASMYSTPYIEDWAGKLITIYVANIRAFGSNVDCLRIRSTKPVIKKLEELTPKSKQWQAAKGVVQNNGYTIEQVRKKYTITDENYKLLEK